MLIANFLKYKHRSPCWVYIIHILTPLVKPFQFDIINLAKHNEEEEHKWTR
jgi:mitochondrial fission protein ELM1